jgi:hypothetical protein
MAAALRLVAESHTARARAAASAAAAAAATIATSVGSAPSYDRAQLLGRALTDQAPAGGELRGLVPAAPASQLNAASTAGTLHNISGTGAPVVAYNQGTTKSTAGALSGTSVLPSSAAPSAPAEPARASTSTVINPGAAAAAAAARHLLRSELPPVLEEPHMVLYPPSAPSLQGMQCPAHKHSVCCLTCAVHGPSSSICHLLSSTWYQQQVSKGSRGVCMHEHHLGYSAAPPFPISPVPAKLFLTCGLCLQGANVPAVSQPLPTRCQSQCPPLQRQLSAWQAPATTCQLDHPLHKAQV